LQHNNQLRALPRAQPRLRGSTPLAAGAAEGDLRLPDRDSQPLVTQGRAVEPTPPPKKSARRSHVEIMSSTVSRFSQAPQSYVLMSPAVPRAPPQRRGCWRELTWRGQHRTPRPAARTAHWEGEGEGARGSWLLSAQPRGAAGPGAETR